MDWAASYSYANRQMLDRRLIERTDRTDQTIGIYRTGREETKLDEHIMSAAANYQKQLCGGRFGEGIAENGTLFSAKIKSGVYGEYRTRTYSTHQFQLGWNPENSLPKGWLFDRDVQHNIPPKAPTTSTAQCKASRPTSSTPDFFILTPIKAGTSVSSTTSSAAESSV